MSPEPPSGADTPEPPPAGPPTREAVPMAPKYHHTPAKPVSTRARCPVCHEAVYSTAGIHPQCAVKRADPPRPKVKTPPEAGSI